MASTKIIKASRFLASLADKQAPCAFCRRMVDEETTYGKLYRIGDIHCHYFCVLLSCCLIQRGKDEDGLFGFLYPDILAEIERSKKHKCSYCSREGATLGCSVSQCRKQFHLPCGREKQAVSLFYGNYKSFCKDHAPKQKIADTVMAKARVRMSIHNKLKREKRQNSKKINKKIKCETECQETVESVCVICYESVDGFPTNQTFWPPCCGRDAWFHRSCLERMALSAGVHYLKCPLCNDKDHFYKAVLDQGYYIPDRDAAWELEQNAFSDIYERAVVCSVEDCKCPMGREYDADSGAWDISLCLLCGGAGAHAHCGRTPRVCAACAPAMPSPQALHALARVPLPSQSGNTQRRRVGPVMPSRMSLRRTKARSTLYNSSTSNSTRSDGDKSVTEISRQELNLKAPRGRISEHSPLKSVENKLLSPLKLLNRDLYDKLNEKSLVLDQNVLEEVRHKFKRPKPLVVKKKIINEILERFINNISKESTKTKESIREWNSPKKLHDEGHTLEENMPDISKTEATEPDITGAETKDELTIEVEVNENSLAEDDDSNSTFQLPSEFIADYNSDQSLPIFDTPKKLKKINIENDLIEISENDQIINIDLIKTENDGCLKNVSMPEKTEKYAFKFSTFDKEVLEKNNLDIDIETFKNQYLSEVDRQFKDSKQKHKLNDFKKELCENDESNSKKPPKRKRSTNSVASKRRKTTKMVENSKSDKEVEKKRRKSKTHLSIRNKNINLKIRFKDEKLKLKISKRKKKNKKLNKDSPKVLRQYVLNCLDNVISRPDIDVVPLKKHQIKTEKVSDNLKQTSLDSFFKIKL
ncbi:uncharacterized protein LOC125075333 [Vanessa atalanta]|uniref:uncharacterized protein LOC125075333 n=1 Tax=Vanessa atalanta TaxID=42275 RepID=UPI001FCDA17E|nr:uncharacterized protein LOC125075333 [Vanessa atalanta]